MKIDADEKELLESVERGEWKSAGGGKRERARFSRYAKATFRKDRRLNIRLSSKDLEAIQKRALAEGLPYQTLIASLLHKYAAGRLKESDERLSRFAKRRSALVGYLRFFSASFTSCQFSDRRRWLTLVLGALFRRVSATIEGTVPSKISVTPFALVRSRTARPIYGSAPRDGHRTSETWASDVRHRVGTRAFSSSNQLRTTWI